MLYRYSYIAPEHPEVVNPDGSNIEEDASTQKLKVVSFGCPAT